MGHLHIFHNACLSNIIQKNSRGKNKRGLEMLLLALTLTLTLIVYLNVH